MKILTEEYWKKFERTLDKKTKKDGVEFENLCKSLLEQLYGNDTWKKTPGSWDGSKDFYFYSDNEKVWAECKNYHNSISLNVLAPTLVMAQVMAIDEILFFSYSPIVINTKHKIMTYASNTGKHIRFFDDEALEQLILQYGDEILPIYFKDFCLERMQTPEPDPVIEHYVLPNPLLAYEFEMQPIQKKFPQEVDLHQLLLLNFFIENKTCHKLICSFQIASDPIIYKFLIKPEDLKSGEPEIVLEPYESTNYHIYIEPNVYEPVMKFPNIIVTYQTKAKKASRTFAFGNFKCNWIADKSLMGANYLTIKGEFEKDLNKLHFNSTVLVGTSGTGKTRLLQELVNVSLKNGYRIFQFSANANKNDNASICLSGIEIIKEIIYALWQIPNFEILEEAQNAIWNNTESTPHMPGMEAFQIIREFSSIASENEFKTALKNYGNLIFEKLKSQKVVLAIDNIQFYDKNIIQFLDFIYEKSHILMRECRFKVIEIFNVDYIQPNGPTESHLISLKRYGDSIREYRMEGFKDENESIIFVRQLLSPDIDLSNEDLHRIVKNSENNPFFLTQYIQYLFDCNILSIHGNKCTINEPEDFHRVLASVPDTIDKLLAQRWENLSKSFDKESCLDLFSAIHFLGSLDLKMAHILGFKDAHIETLAQLKFVKTIAERSYKIEFYHDNIESFFCRKIDDFPDRILKKEKEFEEYIREGSFQWYWYKIKKNEDISEEEFFTLINGGLGIFVSPKQASTYYQAIFDYMMKKRGIISKYSQWLECLEKVCSLLRDISGSENALSYYEIAYQALNKDECIRTQEAYFRWLVRYTEACDEAGRIQTALRVLQNYLKEVKPCSAKNLCSLYNRLHVYRRHLCTEPLNNREQEQWLKESMRLAEAHKLSECIYVNLSDLGYLYYSESKYRSQLMSAWERAIRVFEKNEIPQKTLNYYRKKVQLCMLSNDVENALKYCIEGEEYIENGSHSYEKLFFRHWFSIAKAYCFLMDRQQFNTVKFKRQLDLIEEYQALLKSPKRYLIYSVKMLFYIYINKPFYAIQYFQKAVNDLEESTQKTHVDVFRQFLIDNVAVAMLQNKSYVDELKNIDSQLSEELIQIFQNLPTCVCQFIESRATESVLQTNNKQYNLIPL